MAIDWGSAPAWTAALGGLATLSLSVRVAWIQVKDRRQEQADRRMIQARLVTAWVDDGRVLDDFVARVLIRNASDQAVYRLTVALGVGVRGRYAVHRSALGPGDVWEYEFHLPGYPHGELDAPALRFTDASGLDWIRTGVGQLRPYVHDDEANWLDEEAGAFDSIEARDASVKALRSQTDENRSAD